MVSGSCVNRRQYPLSKPSLTNQLPPRDWSSRGRNQAAPVYRQLPMRLNLTSGRFQHNTNTLYLVIS